MDKEITHWQTMSAVAWVPDELGVVDLRSGRDGIARALVETLAIKARARMTGGLGGEDVMDMVLRCMPSMNQVSATIFMLHNTFSYSAMVGTRHVLRLSGHAWVNVSTHLRADMRAYRPETAEDRWTLALYATPEVKE